MMMMQQQQHLVQIDDCIDGNTAACHVAYALTEACFIYPITPSSPMAELADVWSSQGRLNVLGRPVSVTQMQSEGGAAGALHGAASAGALVTTFTASQGLLLMVPVMYKIAGELLPVVFHVAARQVGSTANSIFGEHSDVMAARQTGVCMLSSHSVQEVMDLALVAHVAALRGSLPVLHFFDGFQVSHEIQRVKMIPYEIMAPFLEQELLDKNRARATNPTHPSVRSMLNGRDTLFQAQEANNKYWEVFPDIVDKAMRDVGAKIGRHYQLFEYKGASNAELIIILMGAGSQAVGETVDYLVKTGERVGYIKVHLFRPWSLKHFLESIPSTCKAIAVLDRCREPGSIGEPLYLDVAASVLRSGLHINVIGGRFGMGDKAFTPAMVVSVFDNLKQDKPKHPFTVGIEDDVTHLSLKVGPAICTVPQGTKQCIFWGLGADGTVGANRAAISLIGRNTPLYTQGYFYFTAHKAGGVTTSHLRFGPSPITSSYPIQEADYVACHHPSYVRKFPLMLVPLREGGIFVLNCIWPASEIEFKLPANFKKLIAKKNAKVFIINAYKISSDAGIGGFINLVMQAVFFKLSQVIPWETASELLKQSVEQTYKKKGDTVIQNNQTAIDSALAGLVEITYNKDSWLNVVDVAESSSSYEGAPDWVSRVKIPIDEMRGEQLPVSAFNPSGIAPTATAQFEKRCIATRVPRWNPDSCVQCATCSLVCPHASIRPFLLSTSEITCAPPGLICKPAKGVQDKELQFRIQISPMDCTGCGMCMYACPVKGTLTMVPIEEELRQQVLWNFVEKLPPKPNQSALSTLKGSQLKRPLFEFSGACSGCGEAAYMKLLTQLFGERMSIIITAGCSSAVAVSFGSCPYTKTELGWGPNIQTSLFENCAEYGLGSAKGHDALRAKLALRVREVLKSSADKISENLQRLFNKWLNEFNDPALSLENSKAIIPLVDKEHENNQVLDLIWREKDVFPKISHWTFGGDGWAYDIDFGGLDHVLNEGHDIKILIMDTELYSNTGGQKSKGSAKGSVAKFAYSGHDRNKKDFGSIVMGYETVYLAQVALNANPMQTLKAFLEADSYPGPAVIIAYSPCIEHGIAGSDWIEETKLAVATGYWPLYRFNPSLRAEGKNPFQLDSKITKPVEEFIARENRFVQLQREHPERAAKLHAELAETTRKRFQILQKKAEEVPIPTSIKPQ